MMRQSMIGCRHRFGLLVLLAAFVIVISSTTTLGADDPVQADGEEKKKGFMSRFNEPATGPGLVLTVGYFHPTKGSPSSEPERKGAPPVGVGADIVRGPEDTVGYLTLGSAW